jgi:hypothetical protein
MIRIASRERLSLSDRQPMAPLQTNPPVLERRLKLTISPVELMRRHSAHEHNFLSSKSMPVSKRLLDSCWTPTGDLVINL